jgi:hypothetical protein
VAASEVSLSGERDGAEQGRDSAFHGVELIHDLVDRCGTLGVGEAGETVRRLPEYAERRRSVSTEITERTRGVLSGLSLRERLVARSRELGDRQPGLSLLDQNVGQHDFASTEA